jgi:hypothetical protein
MNTDNKKKIKRSLNQFISIWNKEKRALIKYKNARESGEDIEPIEMHIRDTDALRAIQLLAQIEGMLEHKEDSINISVIKPKFKIQ